MLDNWEGEGSFRSSLVIGRGLENIKLEDYCLMKCLNLYFFFSCHGDPNQKRNRLIMPSLSSSRIYIFDVETDPRAPRIHKV